MMMMVVVMGIQFSILVEHLAGPPGPTYRRFPGGPVGLPAPLGNRRPLVVLACLARHLSLILVAHGWDVIGLQCSEHARLASRETVIFLDIICMSVEDRPGSGCWSTHRPCPLRALAWLGSVCPS